MRYYLFTVQYNSLAEAENRTVPKAFNDLNSAIAEFHSQISRDMKNEVIGWSLNMIINSDGGIHKQEKYVNPNPITPTPPEPEPEPEPTPEPEPEPNDNDGEDTTENE